MLQPVFLDPGRQPTDIELTDTLRQAFPFFSNLRNLTIQKQQEWKFYNKKSGWVFKVRDTKKAVFYLTPLPDKFQIGMALNEKERSSLISSTLCAEYKEILMTARKYQEGYAFHTYVENETDEQHILELLTILNKL
jgi:hypothetical protein